MKILKSLLRRAAIAPPSILDTPLCDDAVIRKTWFIDGPTGCTSEILLKAPGILRALTSRHSGFVP